MRLFVAGADVRIVAEDVELLRALTLGPTRSYQPLGGRWPVNNVPATGVHDVLGQPQWREGRTVAGCRGHFSNFPDCLVTQLMAINVIGPPSGALYGSRSDKVMVEVNYYESLAALRQRLEAAGESGFAEELLQAERGGTTSSELLSETGIVLRQLLESGTAKRLQMVTAIEALDRLGRDLFQSTNPKW